MQGVKKYQNTGMGRESSFKSRLHHDKKGKDYSVSKEKMKDLSRLGREGEIVSVSMDERIGGSLRRHREKRGILAWRGGKVNTEVDNPPKTKRAFVHRKGGKIFSR